MKRLFQTVCDEPYRLFFPLGVLIGMIGVGHWLLYAVGWMKGYSSFFHSSLQMQAYMSCFVFGFLLTAMPRFSGTSSASGKEVGVFAAFILAIPVFLSFGQWVAAEFCYAALLIALASFAVRRVLSKKADDKVQPPVEFVWIPIGLLHGLLGSLLLIGAQLKVLPFFLLGVGKLLEEQGFLMCIVLGIGGFLAPRLMGRHEPARGVLPEDKKNTAALRTRQAGVHLLSGMLLFASFWMEGLGKKVPAYFLRAAVVSFQLFRNHILPRPPRIPDLFVQLLWYSFWCVFVGTWATVFFPQYRTAMLHIVLIGGFSLMTFSVATMVTLSHSGSAGELKKPLWFLKIVGSGIAVVLTVRVLSVFFPLHYFHLLGVAAAFWIGVGAVWLCAMAPKMLSVPVPEEFERCHEEAKQRIREVKKSAECCSHKGEDPAGQEKSCHSH